MLMMDFGGRTGVGAYRECTQKAKKGTVHGHRETDCASGIGKQYSETVTILRQWGGSVQVRVTYFSEQQGVEIQVKSMMNTGTLS